MGHHPAVILFALLFTLQNGFASQSPEQVHLSLTGDLSQMFVTWLTMDEVTAQTYVRYGRSPHSLDHTVLASKDSFTDTGPLKIVRYVFKGTMKNLQPNTVYYYQVGSPQGYSKVFNFKTFPRGEFPFRICIFGDLGIKNGQFDDLIEGTEKGFYDMVIHVGDIAYDLHKDNGNFGDQFLRIIEPVASKIPYMVIVGNHEQQDDFLHYRKRFTMPDNGTVIPDNGGYFYSFEAGLVHFAGLSSEFYAQQWKGHAVDQFNWLEKDLKANSQPWTISYIHRPMYCSNNSPGWTGGDCTAPDNNLIRMGGDGYPGLEAAFMNNGVDFAFYGHMHSYERMWPVYNKIVFKQGQQAGRYYNSPTPVHVITGSAGCHTPHTPQDSNEAWSCVRSEDFGITVVHIHNATHAHLRQFSTEQHLDVDAMWLIKEPGHRPGKI